jgi:hypothetical protein
MQAVYIVTSGLQRVKWHSESNYDAELWAALSPVTHVIQATRMGPSCTDLCCRDSELVGGGITMRGHEACVGDVNENGIDGK